MLDGDLAEIYQVPTKRLNEAVRRNRSRFPDDFMFQLTSNEENSLRSQIATLEQNLMRSQFATASKRNIRYQPYAFTEHGIAMLSSVINSERAIAMNIFIIRAFIQHRKMLLEQKTFSKQLQKIEAKVNLFGQVVIGMVEDIKRLKNPPKINAIGFQWRPKTKI